METLQLIRDMIDTFDGELDAEGKPVKTLTIEQYEELVNEIYQICDRELSVQ